MKPGGLDKWIAQLSPGWALRRAQDRQRLEMFGYIAAGGNPFGRSPTDMSGSGDSQLDEWKLDDLRDLSREKFRNDPLYAAIIMAHVDNVVHNGFTFDPQTGSDSWNQRLTEWWEERRNRPIDAAGRFTFRATERLVGITKAVDGDLGFVKHEDATFTPVEGDRIREPAAGADPKIVNGIETDRIGRPVAYHIADVDPNSRDIAATSTRYLADQFIYVGTPLRFSSNRAAPVLAPAFPLFDDVGQLRESVNKAAIVAACLASYVSSDKDTQFSTLTFNKDADGNERATADILPGTITQLPKDSTLHSITPGQPSQWLPQHFNMLFRLAGRLAGVPIEVSLMFLSDVTYSSARIGLLEARRTWETFQAAMESGFHQPVVRHLIETAIATGELRAPPTRVKDPARHGWIPPPWQWVDPEKEVDAAIKAIKHNLGTEHEIARSKGFRDEDQMFKQRALEIRKAIDAAEKEGLPKYALLSDLAEQEKEGKKQNAA